MSYKAILFDADGVLQTTSASWRQGFAKFLPDPDDVDTFLNEVFAAEAPCLTSDLDFTTELSKVLFEWEISHSVDDVLTMWQQIFPIDGMQAVVRWVRQEGFAACLATNQQTYRANYMRYELDYNSWFDHQFYSCDLMAAKPTPDFFFEIILRLDMKPSELLYIDDSEKNIQAAMTLGIDSIEFRALDYQHPADALSRLLETYIRRNI